MKKRSFERISTSIGVRFFSGESEYHGTVTNLSEKGMFINTKVNFPLKPQLEIFVPMKKEVLNFPVTIKRFNKSGDVYNAIGVELLHAPQSYVEFVNTLRSSKTSPNFFPEIKS
jgi:hypothetical protein